MYSFKSEITRQKKINHSRESNSCFFNQVQGLKDSVVDFYFIRIIRQFPGRQELNPL